MSFQTTMIRAGALAAASTFAIALASRDLLVQAAERDPVVVVVDDLPWIDAPTRRTLAYIARRLQFERVAIMSARRAGTDSHSDTGPTYVLDAVNDDVADRILVDAGVDSADVRRQLIAELDPGDLDVVDPPV